MELIPKIIADLRENILREARVLLLHGGFETLTMRSVASACRVAVGTVYNYFPSKEMLAASVVLQDWQITLQAMDRCAAEAASALDGLEQIARELTAFWDVYRTIWRQYEAAGHAAPLQGPYRKQLIGQLVAVIRPVLERFRCLHEDVLPEFLAETLLSAAREGSGRFLIIAPIIERILQ